MKTILLSSIALIGLTAGAMAADLPSRRAPPQFIPAAPVFTWTGFYAGLNAGYGFSASDRNSNAFGVAPGSGAALTGPLAGYTGTVTPGGNGGSRDGFVGGGQIGYNYQMGSFVIGIEADAQYADLGGRRTGTTTLAPAPAGFAGATGNNLGGIDWFGTVRGRVGYAFDRALVYGTGGFAYGDGPTNRCNVATGVAVAGCNANNDLRTGYAAGGGIEYAFTPNLTGKIEGLYVNLDRRGNDNFVGAVGGTAVYATGRRAQDDDFAVVRAGLNYKFNMF